MKTNFTVLFLLLSLIAWQAPAQENVKIQDSIATQLKLEKSLAKEQARIQKEEDKKKAKEIKAAKNLENSANELKRPKKAERALAKTQKAEKQMIKAQDRVRKAELKITRDQHSYNQKRLKGKLTAEQMQKWEHKIGNQRIKLKELQFKQEKAEREFTRRKQ